MRLENLDVETMSSRAVTAARTLADATRDSAARATRHARERGSVAFDRARSLAGHSGETMKAWTSGGGDLVRTRPLPALAVAVGIGYLIGRMLKRA